MNAPTEPSWLRPMLIRWTPQAIRVLMQLVEAGLARGECSPNDITDRYYPEPNVVGAVFKALPKFGFQQADRRINSVHASQHGRKVFVWECVDSMQAQRLLLDMKCAMLGERQPENGQLIML